MCLQTNWTLHRLQITSDDITDTISLDSSIAETVQESFQDTLSLSESEQTQVDPRQDPNRTIWDIPIQIHIQNRNGNVEDLPRYPQGPGRV